MAVLLRLNLIEKKVNTVNNVSMCNVSVTLKVFKNYLTTVYGKLH